MAIREEKRRGAPIPSVETTAYGAEYVNSATETPVVEEGAAEGVEAVAEQQLTENEEVQVQEAEDAQKEQGATAIESATVDATSVKVEGVPVEATTAPARKKGGRPKKK